MGGKPEPGADVALTGLGLTGMIESRGRRPPVAIIACNVGGFVGEPISTQMYAMTGRVFWLSTALADTKRLKRHEDTRRIQR
jgi:hypothetical protein